MTLACSYCSKSEPDVRKLITGHGIYICNECVGVATEKVSNAEIAGIADSKERCRFCGNFQTKVKKLLPPLRLAVCDECVDLFNEILDEAGLPHAPHSNPGRAYTIEETLHCADNHYGDGRFEEAEPYYLLALVLLERVHEEHHPRVLACMEDLGNTFIASEKWRDAASVYRSVAAVRTNHKLPASLSFLKLAQINERLNNVNQAADDYQRAIKLGEHEMENGALADVLDSYANMLTRAGRNLEEAERMEKWARQLRAISD